MKILPQLFRLYYSEAGNRLSLPPTVENGYSEPFATKASALEMRTTSGLTSANPPRQRNRINDASIGLRGAVGRLVGSAGVRLGIVHAAIFGIGALVLALLLWYSTVGILQRQLEVAVRNDAAALNDVFMIGGITALNQAIEYRLAEDSTGDDMYLLVDNDGIRIAGNLGSWPANLNQTATWYEIPVELGGVRATALLRAYAVKGGNRLLIGREARAQVEVSALLRNVLIWAIICMLLLASMGAFIIHALFQRMIGNISATAYAILRGDLTRRVSNVGGGDEFSTLAVTINDMLDKIINLMDSVKNVSNAIAHDLRTPITRARNGLEDALYNANSSDEFRSATSRAIDDLDGIANIFQALMRIADIEYGSHKSHFVSVDLAEVIADIDELYCDVAADREITLKSNTAGSLAVFGDRDLIFQAIVNLIENAIKFSSCGMVIAINATRVNGSVEVVVADHGPGIADWEKTRVLERFYRAESARNTPGSGLGLALVAAVARSHRGSISLHDNLPGLRVVFSIPLKPEI